MTLRTVHAVSLLLCCALAVMIGCAPVYPLHSQAKIRYSIFTSYAELRQKLLTHTPLGTHQRDVITFLQRELAAERVSHTVKVERIKSKADLTNFSDNTSKKAHTIIRAWFLSYTGSSAVLFGFPLRYDVYAEYVFDRNGRLMDIYAINEGVGF